MLRVLGVIVAELAAHGGSCLTSRSEVGRGDGTEPVRGGCYFFLRSLAGKDRVWHTGRGRDGSPLIHRLVREGVLLVGSRVVDPGRAGSW